MAVVYKHHKETNGQVFYIGIGAKKKRAYERKSRNALWHNIVNKHGYYVSIHKSGISYEEAKREEIRLIREYGRIDVSTGVLCNMTDGGDGNNGLSKEVRDRISKSLTGRKMSKDRIEKLSKTLKVLWNSEEYSEKREIARIRAIKNKDKISRLGSVSPRKGVVLSDESKNKLSKSMLRYYELNPPKRKHWMVTQLDKNGVEILKWKSHHEASDFIGVRNSKNIISVCNGKRKHFGGFKWKFQLDENGEAVYEIR